MKFAYLEAFVSAADKGSITAAARSLGKSHGTLSVALSNLEVDLGVALFDRSGHKPVLTPYGEELLEYARSVLSMSDTLVKKAHGLNKGIEPSLTLAVDDCMSPGRLTDLLKQIQLHYPQLNLELLQPSSPDIPALVQQNRAQLGITVNQSVLPVDYHSRTLGHLQMVVIAGADHPLAGRTHLSLEDMAGHLQIWPASRHSLHAFFYPPVSPHRWTVERMSEVVDMVEAGIGWSVVPSHLVAAGLKRKTLVELDHEMSSASQVLPVDMIWHKGLSLGPAARWIISNVENFISDL